VRGALWAIAAALAVIWVLATLVAFRF